MIGQTLPINSRGFIFYRYVQLLRALEIRKGEAIWSWEYPSL